MPRWLIGDVTRKKLFDDMGSSMLEQLALARFIDAGALGRHLRRVRPIYRRRRECSRIARHHAAGCGPDGHRRGLARVRATTESV